MSVVYFMRGLPAAGKSTFARNLANSHNATVLAKDNLRRWLCPADEYAACDLHFIERMRDANLKALLAEGKDVVLDETFIEVADIKRAMAITQEFDAEQVLVDLTAVLFDELYDRDSTRLNRVGFNVLMDAWIRLEREREAFTTNILPNFDLVMSP